MLLGKKGGEGGGVMVIFRRRPMCLHINFLSNLRILEIVFKQLERKE